METEQSSVAVALQIYSGRPDPTWELDPAQIEDFAGRVRESIGGERLPSSPPVALGYRGFRVRSRNVSGVPEEFTVGRRVLSQEPGLKGVHWLDRGDAESWLLEDARRRGFGQTLIKLGIGPKSSGGAA